MDRLLLFPLVLGLGGAAAACGNAAVIAPEPLAVVDTAPGNGSLVPAGQTAIAVLFSIDVDPKTLPAGVKLEEVTPGGTVVEGVKTTLQNYDAATFTATFTVDPLPAGEAFRLTVKRDTVRAVSGAILRADLIRTFATGS